MENIEGNKSIICPWCDREQEKEIKFHDGDGFIVECEECGNEFFVEAHVEFRFYCSYIVDAEFEENKLETEDDKDE